MHLVEYVSSTECCRDDVFTDGHLRRRTKGENLPTSAKLPTYFQVLGFLRRSIESGDLK